MARGLGTATLRTSLDTSGLRQGLGQARQESDRTFTQFDRRMDQTGRRMQRFGRNMTLGVTGPIVAAGTAAVASAVQVGNYADKILDLEQQTGLATDTLQEFENVARAAGVNSDVLAGAAEGLTRRLRESGEESRSFTDAVSALGVSTRDASGNLRSMDDLMPDLIGSLGSVENITERNAVAMQVFGRRATELAPVLALGTDEINRLTQEARDMGQVLDRDALNGANNFRIEFEQLQAELGLAGREIQQALIPAMTGFATTLRSDVVPFVQELAERTAAVIEWWNELDDGTKRLTVSMVGAAAAIGPVSAVIGTLVRTIPQVTAALRAMQVAMAFMGPGGLIIGAASIVGGLALAMGGRGGSEPSLTEAIESANNVAAETGGFESLEGTLESLAGTLSGTVKAAFEGAVEDIWSIVNAAEDAQAALTRVSLGSAVQQQLLGDTDLQNILRGVINLGDTDTTLAGDVQEALVRGDFESAESELRRAVFGLQAAGASDRELDVLNRAIDVIIEARNSIARIGQEPSAPPGRTGGAGAAGTAAGAVGAEAASGVGEEAARVFRDSLTPFEQEVQAQMQQVARIPIEARERREAARRSRIASQARFESQEWMDAFMSGLRRRAEAEGWSVSLPMPGIVAGTPEARALPQVQPFLGGDARSVGDPGVQIDARRLSEREIRVERRTGMRESAARTFGSPEQQVAYTEQLRQQWIARQGSTGLSGVAQPGLTILPALDDTLTTFEAELRASSGALAGVDWGEWRRETDQASADAAARQEAAADQFAQTVVGAAGQAGQVLIGAIRGDVGPGGLISGLGGAASSIVGAVNPLVGSIIGVGSSLVGSLLDSGGPDRESARRAEGARTRGAPAISLNLQVFQDIGTLSLAQENRAQVDSFLDETVSRIEQVVTRSLAPRLNRVEERVDALAGA